jgi:hypothetical protein
LRQRFADRGEDERAVAGAEVVVDQGPHDRDAQGGDDRIAEQRSGLVDYAIPDW